MSNNIELALIQFTDYVKPKVSENLSQNWVLNGVNNEFFQTIIDLNNGSATNGSINRSYTDLMIGRGLSFKPTRDGAAKNAQDWAKLNQILSKKTIRRLVSDWQVFAAVPIEVQTDNNNELINIGHIPREQVVPSIETDEGIIESYWHSRDWKKTFEAKYKPINYPAFGTTKEGIEIFMLESFTAGQKYFESPWYISGLQYAEAEQEISNMYNSAIKKGLSVGFIVNVKNGINWTPETKADFKKNLKDKLTGTTNTNDFVIGFNGEDVEVTVVPFPVNEQVHKQWEVLNSECVTKIMTAHRAISTSIIGVTPSTGFSSTGEEMDTAERQLMKRVINPRQDMFTDALESILQQFDINLDLYFLPLTEEVVKADAVQMSSHVCMSEDGATSEMADTLIKFGLDGLENYQLLCGSEVDYDTDDDLLGLVQFATSTGTARPLAKSEQDSEDIKILYRFVGNPIPEREFCIKMMLANKLYRKEDILQMDKSGINDGFGLGGSNSYSIWLWKGGGKMSANFPEGTCKHKWQREIYLRKGSGLDPRSPLAETISTSEARRRGYFVPTNDSDVSIAPHSNK
jgi:hypothetical protein